MRKIIEGKVYDTKTAEHVGEYSNNLGRGDFRYVSEDLYRTKKGTFFLAGEGGAMSKYAESNGNESYGSSNLNLLTEEEARVWCEQHQDDLLVPYESLFDVEEG